jgi:tRNA pseudouridine32 synthase/23S rRNA pseudouridine746 synthase
MLEVLHVDDALLALNKPAGLPVQPDGWDPNAPYLLQEAQAEYGRLWIVHRLDKSTTGVILLARVAEAHRALSMAFERHEARKIYHAIVDGSPVWRENSCRQPLLTNVGHRHRTVVQRRHGKASRTEFLVRERFDAHALLEAHPHTGRTHQIRAHAAAVGHPILADILYGAPPTNLISRVALHALKLEFHHPITGNLATLEAPYPDDFQKALGALRAR